MSSFSHSPNADSSGFPFTPYTLGGGEPLRRPVLDVAAEADVVIIGGGIAGISTALHASLAGLKAIVLEAKEVGWGASSRNSGHVPAATRQEPAAILKNYGPNHGKKIIQASREAPELVFGLIDRYGIEADPVRTGGVQAAHTDATLAKLRDRVEVLKRFGYELKLLDADQTCDIVGCAGGIYKGATVDPAGGTMNPLAYVRGIARAAVSEGALIFEHSPVHDLNRSGDRWLARTTSGSVRAKFALVATNGYSHGLLPKLWRSIVAIRAYQFMTEPLPQELRDTVLPGRQGFTDTRRMMSGVRVHKDGRLHFSGLGPMFGAEREPNIAGSMARIRHMFPQLRDVAFDYWWSGWMGMNEEHTWKIHEIEPGLLAILGCNGRGVGLATIYGRDLAGYMAGKSPDDLALPFDPVRPIFVHPVRQPLVSALAVNYRIMDAIETGKAIPRQIGAVREDSEHSR